MLDAFLIENRDLIIARAKARVAARKCPKPQEIELTNGIPLFLDQLATALSRARATDDVDHDDISKSAALHGHDLLRMGLTIAQVVHDYGDVCQDDHLLGARAASSDRRRRIPHSQSLPR